MVGTDNNPPVVPATFLTGTWEYSYTKSSWQAGACGISVNENSMGPVVLYNDSNSNIARL